MFFLMHSHENITEELIKIYFTIFLAIYSILILIELFTDNLALETKFIINFSIFFLLALIACDIYLNTHLREQFRIAQTSDPWWINSIMYFFVFLVSFNLVDLLTSTINSPENFINSLFQAQAAVIAIVFSLTLIVLQIGAQKYPSRIIDAYKNYPDLWILLTIFIFSMTLNFLISISPGATKIVVIGIQINFLFLSLILGVFCFFSLFAYIWNIMNLLRIENTVGIISYMISPCYNEKKFLKDEFQRLQSIFDVITQSYEKRDNMTILVSLDRLKSLLDRIHAHDEVSFYLFDERVKMIDKNLFQIRTEINLINDSYIKPKIETKILEINNRIDPYTIFTPFLFEYITD